MALEELNNWENFIQVNIYGQSLKEIEQRGVDLKLSLNEFGFSKFSITEGRLYSSDSDSGMESSFDDTMPVLSSSIENDVKWPRCSTPLQSQIIERKFTFNATRAISRIPADFVDIQDDVYEENGEEISKLISDIVENVVRNEKSANNAMMTDKPYVDLREINSIASQRKAGREKIAGEPEIAVNFPFKSRMAFRPILKKSASTIKRGRNKSLRVVQTKSDPTLNSNMTERREMIQAESEMVNKSNDVSNRDEIIDNSLPPLPIVLPINAQIGGPEMETTMEITMDSSQTAEEKTLKIISESSHEALSQNSTGYSSPICPVLHNHDSSDNQYFDLEPVSLEQVKVSNENNELVEDKWESMQNPFTYETSFDDVSDDFLKIVEKSELEEEVDDEEEEMLVDEQKLEDEIDNGEPSTSTKSRQRRIRKRKASKNTTVQRGISHMAQIDDIDRNKTIEVFCKYQDCGHKMNWKMRYGKLRLLDHALAHFGKKFFKCKQCNYECETSRRIRNHYITLHPNDKVEGYGMRNLPTDEQEIINVWNQCYEGILQTVGMISTQRSHRISKKRKIAEPVKSQEVSKDINVEAQQ